MKKNLSLKFILSFVIILTFVSCNSKDGLTNKNVDYIKLPNIDYSKKENKNNTSAADPAETFFISSTPSNFYSKEFVSLPKNYTFLQIINNQILVYDKDTNKIIILGDNLKKWEIKEEIPINESSEYKFITAKISDDLNTIVTVYKDKEQSKYVANVQEREQGYLKNTFSTPITGAPVNIAISNDLILISSTKEEHFSISKIYVSLGNEFDIDNMGCIDILRKNNSHWTNDGNFDADMDQFDVIDNDEFGKFLFPINDKLEFFTMGIEPKSKGSAIYHFYFNNSTWQRVKFTTNTELSNMIMNKKRTKLLLSYSNTISIYNVTKDNRFVEVSKTILPNIYRGISKIIVSDDDFNMIALYNSSLDSQDNINIYQLEDNKYVFKRNIIEDYDTSFFDEEGFFGKNTYIAYATDRRSDYTRGVAYFDLNNLTEFTNCFSPNSDNRELLVKTSSDGNKIVYSDTSATYTFDINDDKRNNTEPKLIGQGTLEGINESCSVVITEGSTTDEEENRNHYYYVLDQNNEYKLMDTLKINYYTNFRKISDDGKYLFFSDWSDNQVFIYEFNNSKLIQKAVIANKKDSNFGDDVDFADDTQLVLIRSNTYIYLYNLDGDLVESFEIQDIKKSTSNKIQYGKSIISNDGNKIFLAISESPYDYRNDKYGDYGYIVVTYEKQNEKWKEGIIPNFVNKRKSNIYNIKYNDKTNQLITYANYTVFYDKIDGNWVPNYVIYNYYNASSIFLFCDVSENNKTIVVSGATYPENFIRYYRFMDK